MGPPSLNSNRTVSPGFTSAKALGFGFENPIVMGGHLSCGTGPCEIVMLSGSTLSTFPSAVWVPDALAAGGEAAGAEAAEDTDMLPRTERNRASESMRN